MLLLKHGMRHPNVNEATNWSKVSSVFFMIAPWKFLDSMLKTMNLRSLRQVVFPTNSGHSLFILVSTPSLSATFFVSWHLWGKIPLLSLLNGASFGCNHVQLVTWCYLMLRKSSTTGIMGYQNPTGYKILARQKKTQNHSLGNIFATWTEAKQQGSKHQTHHFIPTTIQKNPPKLIQMQNPLITIQRKKNYPKWCVVHTQSPLPRVFVSCFFGGPVLYDKTSPVILWAFASLHGCSSWRLADPTYQHANGKKNCPWWFYCPVK